MSVGALGFMVFAWGAIIISVVVSLTSLLKHSK